MDKDLCILAAPLDAARIACFVSPGFFDVVRTTPSPFSVHGVPGQRWLFRQPNRFRLPSLPIQHEESVLHVQWVSSANPRCSCVPRTEVVLGCRVGLALPYRVAMPGVSGAASSDEPELLQVCMHFFCSL